MAYNASSKKIDPVKNIKSKASTLILNNKTQPKAKSIEDFKIMEAFMNDISSLLASSNFEYKKILLDEFYTLLTNYKAVTTTDLDSLSDTFISYAKDNILSALDNIQILLENSTDAVRTAIENAFTELEQNNNADLINAQFEQLNVKSDELRSSILNVVNEAVDRLSTIEVDENLLTSNIDAILEKHIKTKNTSNFEKQNADLIKRFSKFINASSNNIVKSIKGANKTLLSSTITRYEKLVKSTNKTISNISKTKTDTKIIKNVIKTTINDAINADNLSKDNDAAKPIKIQTNDLATAIVSILQKNKLLVGGVVNTETDTNKPKSKKDEQEVSNNPVEMFKNILSKLDNISNMLTNQSIIISNKSKKLTDNFAKNPYLAILPAFSKILKNTIGVLLKPITLFVAPILPLVKPLTNVVKRILGGPVSIVLNFIIKCLKNPIVIMGIALVFAFFRNKIVKPVLSFWENIIKPTLDALSPVIDFIKRQLELVWQIVTDITSMFKRFFGDWIDIGFKQAILNLWDRLKAAFPIWFKSYLLNFILLSKDLYYNFIIPKIINPLKHLYYEFVYNPIVKFYNAYIKNPVLKAWHETKQIVTKAYNTLMSYIYKMLAFVTFGETSKTFEAKAIEATNSANASSNEYIPVDINDGTVDISKMKMQDAEQLESDKAKYENEKQKRIQEHNEEIAIAEANRQAVEENIQKRNANILVTSGQSEITEAISAQSAEEDLQLTNLINDVNNTSNETKSTLKQINKTVSDTRSAVADGFNSTAKNIQSIGNNNTNNNVVNVMYVQPNNPAPTIYSPNNY